MQLWWYDQSGMFSSLWHGWTSEHGQRLLPELCRLHEQLRRFISNEQFHGFSIPVTHGHEKHASHGWRSFWRYGWKRIWRRWEVQWRRPIWRICWKFLTYAECPVWYEELQPILISINYFSWGSKIIWNLNWIIMEGLVLIRPTVNCRIYQSFGTVSCFDFGIS